MVALSPLHLSKLQLPTMTEATPLTSSTKAPLYSALSLSLSERQRALKESGVGKAAHLIKDAVFGYQEAPYDGYYDPYHQPENDQSGLRNEISVVCGRLVVWLRAYVVGTSWVLFMLTFFEPPHWCRDASKMTSIVVGEKENEQYGDCKLLFDAQGKEGPYYPNFDSMWLTIGQSKLIEVACVIFISFYLLLRLADDGFESRYFFFPGYKRWTHGIQCSVCVGLLLNLGIGASSLNPFLRMIILGSYLRRFQRELWTFLKMIPDMMIPLSMMAIIVVFYSWFGVIIFYDSPQGIASFPNLAEGMWTLWICVTTANYPDAMMPSYNDNRAVALYFISFMVLSFFYLMNLVLAVAVNTYDESIEQRKRSRKELSTRLLSEAFTLLDHKGEDSVSRQSIMNVMTILNQDIPEVRGLSKEEMAIMYALMDKDGDNEISRDEFSSFGSVLLLKLAKKSDYATAVETYFPSLFRSDSYQTLCRAVKSKRFDTCIEVVLVLNALIISAQDYPRLSGLYKEGDTEENYAGLELVFTMIYVLEVILKIVVNGWKQYIEKPRNAFDFIITVSVVLATAYVYYPNAYSNRELIKLVVMARVLRLGRLLFAVEQFQIFGAISLQIIPAASSVFVVLLFIGYLFAILGMWLFGGAINQDPNNSMSLLEADEFVNASYWANNFNDMFSSMNVLFNWLVINNWTTQTTGLISATGNEWLVRLFFFVFYLLGVIGISNVITSLIINAFFEQLTIIEQRKAPDENVDGEATISGAQAEFDPSSITGTSTSVRGTFIARVQPNHTDVEMNEREALRLLFSKKF